MRVPKDNTKPSRVWNVSLKLLTSSSLLKALLRRLERSIEHGPLPHSASFTSGWFRSTSLFSSLGAVLRAGRVRNIYAASCLRPSANILDRFCCFCSYKIALGPTKPTVTSIFSGVIRVHVSDPRSVLRPAAALNPQTPLFSESALIERLTIRTTKP